MKGRVTNDNDKETAIRQAGDEGMTWRVKLTRLVIFDP